MEKLFLETPTIDRKQDALDYLEENIKYNSDLNGTGNMDRCLNELINRCPSKTYFVVRENDEKIVGMINIRYNISSEKLKSWASHIGYGIRPTERQKGYDKTALFLGLLEEQRLGEKRVLLVCDIDNIGSNKTILALGGELEKTELYKFDNTMTNYYWINVDDALEKYYEQYKCYIKNVSKK